MLSRLVGLSCREIGEQQGRSVATRKLLSRALSQLAVDVSVLGSRGRLWDASDG